MLRRIRLKKKNRAKDRENERTSPIFIFQKQQNEEEKEKNTRNGLISPKCTKDKRCNIKLSYNCNSVGTHAQLHITSDVYLRLVNTHLSTWENVHSENKTHTHT